MVFLFIFLMTPLDTNSPVTLDMANVPLIESIARLSPAACFRSISDGVPTLLERNGKVDLG